MERPFSYVKACRSLEGDGCPLRGDLMGSERPKTMQSARVEPNEFQLMRSKLRAVTPSPKPSPRNIWHPQENFIGPLQNYVPAECRRDENRLVRAVSPSDMVLPRPRPREQSPEKGGPVPRPRTRGRSPQRRAFQVCDKPEVQSPVECPKTRPLSPSRLKGHPASPEKCPKTLERPKTAKVVPDSPEERETTRLSPDPLVCRACGMSPERQFYEVRPMKTGTYPNGIILSPTRQSRVQSPSPERPYRSPSPIKFITPHGIVSQDAFPSLRAVRSRSSTPDLEVKKAMAMCASNLNDAEDPPPLRPISASPSKGKPPKQPGARLSENSPRTHWLVDRPCRSPSPFGNNSPRGPSPSRGINAYMKPPSRGPSPARSENRSRPVTSRGASPSKVDFYLERGSTAPAKRKQSPTPRQRVSTTVSRSNSRSRSQTKAAPEGTKKCAIKLLDDSPELAYTMPSMAIIKQPPDLPAPHTKLRPDSPEIRPRSRSKNSASFVVWKEQKIDLPERMLPSPKKEAKKSVKIAVPNKDEATAHSVAYEGGDASMVANAELIREAQEAMANGSNEMAAQMFDKAIQNVRDELGASSENMFSAVTAAVNMQQEKVSITSGDRAAAFHDEHAVNEKDDVPELISANKGRRGSMRFSALSKIAGMGARSTIAQRKKLEQEAAAAAAKSSRPVSRSSSRASMGENKGGTMSKSSSITSLNKIRSATGVLGSITSLASSKSGKGTNATNSPVAATRRGSKTSANAAYRAVAAASSLVKSPRTQSNHSINRAGASGAEDSDADSVAATPRGTKSRLQSRGSSNTIVNADGTMTSNSRSSSLASVAATPPATRNTKQIMDSAANTVVQVNRMHGRRQSIVMQGQPLIATIDSVPEPSTPALTMRAAGSAAGKAAMMSGNMGGGGASPAEVEIVSEMPGSSKSASKLGSAATMGSKGNESLGEELVARMDSVNASEMEENVSLPPSCCGFRGAWAQKLAQKKWPGLCTKCIRTPTPPKDKKWAKTRKEELNMADPEMQPTSDTPRKPTLLDKLRCCTCCKRKPLPASASSQAPVLPKATPPKLTIGQKLKRFFTCAALRGCCSRMSCARCCSKLSCRGCCAKITCACCCPCFAKCARCSPCCKKCCKTGAVADSTPNPLNKSQPSLGGKRKSRSLPPDPIMRKLDVSLLEANSMIQTAIPVLPVSLAWICLVFNCFIPGLGTILSGAFCMCVGRPRFSVEDKPEERLGTFCLNIMVGIGQLFTVLFCLVGWGWSIWWGTIMVKLAKKHRKLMARAAEELAKPPNPRRPSDPANKK